MPIVDNTKLDTALAAKDKNAIKAALGTLSTGALSKEEKAAIHVGMMESYLDAVNSFNDQYKAFLKKSIETLEKVDKSIGKAEDAEKIEAIKKSF